MGFEAHRTGKFVSSCFAFGFCSQVMIYPALGAAAGPIAYSFGGSMQGGSDGVYPYSGLINVAGTLYGATFYGGTQGFGTVFSFTTSGRESIIYSFGTNPNDGAGPTGRLLNVGGSLYGTTEEGGMVCSENKSGCGTVFKLTPPTTPGGPWTETLIHSFEGGSDGAIPESGLIEVGGQLYGTTGAGGRKGFGTIYRISQAGTKKVIYSFRGNEDGIGPGSGNLLLFGGMLYGTTVGGGSSNSGTLFKVSLAGVESVLWSFKGYPDDGYAPIGDLAQVGGSLYGTTSAGGAGGCFGTNTGCGTVFEYPPSTIPGCIVTPQNLCLTVVLHNFGVDPTDGAAPFAGLIYVTGKLYGTTWVGGTGSSPAGTIYSITPTGVESTVYTFQGNAAGSQGYWFYPQGNLLNVGNMLYGTTQYNGTSNLGTIFKVKK